MTSRPNTIQDEILASDPRIEYLTHICANILEPFGFCPSQVPFLAPMIASMEFIHDKVLDHAETLLDGRMAVDMSLKVTGIIVDNRIGTDFS